MERFGLFASADEVSALFERYDADADGLVSFSEFQTILDADDGHGVKATGATLALTEGHDGRRFAARPRPSTAAPAVSAAAPRGGVLDTTRSPLAARRPSHAASVTPSVAGMSTVSGPGRSTFPSTSQPSFSPAASQSGNTRVRSIANPSRASARDDPEYFKKSSGIFG
jgi:hypothetical protein